MAAQLRAGAPPGAAWAHALGSAVDGQVPDVDVLTAWTGARGQRSRAHAVVAGARVASETGAPLAEVLADLADAVAADAELAGDLEAALAGPRATARVLTLLPVVGLVVGTAMGAQPWRVLLDGGTGSALAVTGVLLVVAGRAWVAALVRRAGGP
ncbi:tight adherence protein B [Cellulomonas sp. KH9]|nr:tight adherence protein B [Cellulomonas sp. KH9]